MIIDKNGHCTGCLPCLGSHEGHCPRHTLKIAATEALNDAECGIFDVTIANIVDASGIPGAEISCRRFAIDGSVVLCASSYDDEIVTLALTKAQSIALGIYLRGYA